MEEMEVLFDPKFLFEYEYLTINTTFELNEFVKTYIPVPKNVKLRVDEQIHKLKKLGYEDSEITTTRWIVFKRISEKSVSFCDSVEIWMPYGLSVEIKDIGDTGKEIVRVLKWVSVDRTRALNDEGMKISIALESELKDLQGIKGLVEKWC